MIMTNINNECCLLGICCWNFDVVLFVSPLPCYLSWFMWMWLASELYDWFAREYSRGWIWCSNGYNWWQANKVADMGHSKCLWCNFFYLLNCCVWLENVFEDVLKNFSLPKQLFIYYCKIIYFNLDPTIGANNEIVHRSLMCLEFMSAWDLFHCLPCGVV